MKQSSHSAELAIFSNISVWNNSFPNANNMLAIRTTNSCEAHTAEVSVGSAILTWLLRLWICPCLFRSCLHVQFFRFCIQSERKASYKTRVVKKASGSGWMRWLVQSFSARRVPAWKEVTVWKQSTERIREGFVGEEGKGTKGAQL